MVNLPDDIINEIMSYRGPHPIHKILKKNDKYDDYVKENEDEEKISFKTYIKYYYHIETLIDKFPSYHMYQR